MTTRELTEEDVLAMLGISSDCCPDCAAERETIGDTMLPRVETQGQEIPVCCVHASAFRHAQRFAA